MACDGLLLVGDNAQRCAPFLALSHIAHIDLIANEHHRSLGGIVGDVENRLGAHLHDDVAGF